MRMGRMSLQRMKSAIISWHGSNYLLIYLFQKHNYTHVVSVLLSFLLPNFRILSAPWAHINDHKQKTLKIYLFQMNRYPHVITVLLCVFLPDFRNLRTLSSQINYHRLIDFENSMQWTYHIFLRQIYLTHHWKSDEKLNEKRHGTIFTWWTFLKWYYGMVL